MSGLNKGLFIESLRNIEVTQIANQPQIVEHSVSEFVEAFVEALAIVLLVSFLSLGWRAGCRPEAQPRWPPSRARGLLPA